MNENNENTSILNFMNENGLICIHKHKNDINPKELDNTYTCGSKCIDIAMCTHGILEHIAGYQLTECDEITLSDHREYLTDVEIERYYKCKINTYDRPNQTI